MRLDDEPRTKCILTPDMVKMHTREIERASENERDIERKGVGFRDSLFLETLKPEVDDRNTRGRLLVQVLEDQS